MERLKAWVKEHPRLAVAAVVGILFLLYLWRRSTATVSPQQTQSGATSYDVQALQAGAQLQALQTQAQIQANSQANQLSAIQIQSATAEKIATINSGTQFAQIAAQRDVALTQIETAAQVQIHQFDLLHALISGQTPQLQPSNPPVVPVVPISSSPVPSPYPPMYPGGAAGGPLVAPFI